MPWYHNPDWPDKGCPSYYQEPMIYACDDGSIPYLLAKKKVHQMEREDCLRYQKLCEAQRDFETARFFRERAAEEMKLYRGCCYALSRLASDPPGDCRNVQANAELAPYIDEVFACVDLDWCARNLKATANA